MRNILLVIGILSWVATAHAAEPEGAAGDEQAVGSTLESEAVGGTGSASSTDVGVGAAGAEPASADLAGENIEQVGFSQGSVTRSIFTTGVEEREPVDDIQSNDGSTEQVFYFTELRDMSGQTATHRWEHNGEVMAEVDFDVRGPRWRVWSSKKFNPDWSGDWKVSVINGAGEVISEDTLSLSAAATQMDTTSESAAAPAPVEEATGQ